MNTTTPLLRQVLRISGRVQGVGYRYHLRLKAQELGILGWCRNLDDGRVYAEIVGTPEQVKALFDWAAQGPATAEVLQVEIEECPLVDTDLPTTFEIHS